MAGSPNSAKRKRQDAEEKLSYLDWPGCYNLIVTTQSSAPQFKRKIVSRFKKVRLTGETYPENSAP